MINKFLDFFLLKNTLFMKIILVFTLPTIGMLYFSTILVSEKVSTLNEIKDIKKSIQHIIIGENLISSLQKERKLSLQNLYSQAVNKKLSVRKAEVDFFYNQYLQYISKLNRQKIHSYNIKKVKDIFVLLKKLRQDISEKKIDGLKLINNYEKINTIILDSIFSIKPILFSSEFNVKFSYLLNLLILKQSVFFERDLVYYALETNNLNSGVYSLLHENFSIQDLNKRQFFLKANIQDLDKYNLLITPSLEEKISEIRRSIDNLTLKYVTNKKQWLELSSSKVEALKKVYEYIISEITVLSINSKDKAYFSQILSFVFLFVSFVTLLSLLFVLRSIIYKEEKVLRKIQKQHEVYELLNKTNKVLLKINDQKTLFDEICKLITKNKNMSYGFIYKPNNKTPTLIAQDSELKNILVFRIAQKDNHTKQNLITNALKEKRAIVIDDYSKDEISGLSDVSKEFKINSAASFPIRKFDEIVAILVLYANETSFFDEEIVILFEKMINDMTHTLEKIDYEKERRQKEKELKLASYAFESNEPMLITDEKATIINANEAFCNVMGYTKDDVIGKKPSLFKSKHQNKKFYKDLWDSLINKGSWSGIVYNTKKDKQIIPLRATLTAIKDESGKINYFFGQYIDISDQIDRQKVLEYQATHDNLTGLPNRLLLLDRIEHAITKTVRHNIIGGLVFIDLDNFKKINDTLGHEVGDNLLIMVAKKIKETIRDEDTISRIGGDEFIVLADNIGKTKEEAKYNMQSLSLKIKDSLNSITHIDGHENISTPSIGVTLFSDASISAKDIIKQADTAMYEAKNKGKNAIEFFN